MALNTLPAGAFADDAITADKINLANNFAFTGTVTGTPTGLTFLQGVDADNSAAAITIGSSSLLSSTYKVFMLQGINLTMATDTANMHVQFIIGGSTKNDAYYSYVRTRMYAGSSTVSGYASQGDTQIPYVGESMGTSAGENGYFTAYLYNPSDTNDYKTFQMISGTQDSSRDQQQNVTSGTYKADTGAVTGISFFSSSGNIAAGRFNLYGVANA
jgi:hypothetical protein